MQEIGLYLFLATSFESVAQYLWSLRKWRENIPAYIALLLALGTVTTLRLDIFGLLGWGGIPYTWVTIVLTGFGLARGANFVNDLIGWVQAKKSIARAEVTRGPITSATVEVKAESSSEPHGNFNPPSTDL